MNFLSNKFIFAPGGGNICDISCHTIKNRQFLNFFYRLAKTNLHCFFRLIFFRHFALAERRYWTR